MIVLYKSSFFKVILIIGALNLLGALIIGHIFLHIHVTEDGKIIVHSHPFSHNPDGADKSPIHHNHSNIEYYFYKVSSEINKYIIIFESDGRQIFESKQYFSYNETILAALILSQLYGLRAPPFC